MNTVLVFPGNMTHAQNIALALREARALDAFVTGLRWRRDGLAARVIATLPQRFSLPALRQFERRSVDCIDDPLVHSYPFWEVLRTGASHFGSPIWADRAWERLSHRLDGLVARRYVPHTEAVQGFEYTSLRTFERARQEGVARILHLPSLDSRSFREIQDREKRAWPELRSPQDAYFDAVFERRYERRQREIALADLIVTNSRLTARSHIAAGAPADKVITVPLAGPSPIAAVKNKGGKADGPLIVLWAGPFSLRKGAHYMMEAWRGLAAGAVARLDVYGSVTVPSRVLTPRMDNIKFHGSVPRAQLFEAYQKADVLVFPTLSDGFGMVVTEALAHGLPVITTDQAGAADLINSDNGLIVPAADAEALKEALVWCLDNRPQLMQMRHHALATSRNRQWSDFRRELIGAFATRMSQCGYRPRYDIAAVGRLPWQVES